MSFAVEPGCQRIVAEISAGELFDKITILEIKLAHAVDPLQRENIDRELAALTTTRDRTIDFATKVQSLVEELRVVNATLWQIEDDIRICEREASFGDRFVQLARSVYHQNDRRGALKRRINELLGSRLVEEKLYAGY